eukprot:gene9906-2228_t
MKTDFPEATGMDALEAKKLIEEQNPELKVELIKHGAPVKKDLRRNSRIWKSENIL